MPKFSILWKMSSEERSFDEKIRCSFWTLALNSEFSMKCICEQNKLRKPSFLEFHRKSLAGERMISGTLELCNEEKQQCLLKKKFICLLEDGCLFTRIDFQCPRNTSLEKSPLKMCLLTGGIAISARTETSLELNELVHLTHTDYASLRQLSNDMESLILEKPFLADASLKCGSSTIRAHKSILSARSPVFEAIFSCPMKEALEYEVIIEDIEEPVLRAMLEYIYTGKTGELTPSLAADLLLAANKYQISSLESVCGFYLMRKMSMKNVARILLLGDFVSPDIKKFAIDFVCNKCKDYSALEKTKDWISLKNNKPDLALEIFSAIVKFQEQKLKMSI